MYHNPDDLHAFQVEEFKDESEYRQSLLWFPSINAQDIAFEVDCFESVRYGSNADDHDRDYDDHDVEYGDDYIGDYSDQYSDQYSDE